MLGGGPVAGTWPIPGGGTFIDGGSPGGGTFITLGGGIPGGGIPNIWKFILNLLINCLFKLNYGQPMTEYSVSQ